jgi:hypothetical protein
MTKLEIKTETNKCQIHYYGDRINGTNVSFTSPMGNHDIILPKFNMKPFQIEEALEELSDYELEESLVPVVDDIREYSSYEDLMIGRHLS